MSMADAVRVRDLEARVVALEERVAQLEQQNNSNLAGRIGLLQGQVNVLRQKVGMKSDDAA